MSTHAGSEGIIKVGDKQIMEVKSWSVEEVATLLTLVLSVHSGEKIKQQ